MVIPLEPVTRCTHLAEGLLEPAKGNHSKWPRAALVCYTDWLQSLLHPPGTTDEQLRAAVQLEGELLQIGANR